MYHKLKNCLNSRSSHKSCSIEKAVLKYFAIFTGKHLCWSLLLIDCGCKTDLQFSCEYCKILRTLILMKIWEQLFLLFLLLAVNISSWVLGSALNSKGLLQRCSLRFKEFFLGCLVMVVGSPLI